LRKGAVLGTTTVVMVCSRRTTSRASSGRPISA
jgi:hypothetical protein